MFDNLVILSVSVIALIAAFCVAEAIAALIFEWLESRMQYGNAKVGNILSPRVNKSKFNVKVRNILALLRFN